MKCKKNHNEIILIICIKKEIYIVLEDLEYY